MPRKIIQIAVAPATELSPAVLYALCDDGTLWSMSGHVWVQVPGMAAEWGQVSNVPQPPA